MNVHTAKFCIGGGYPPQLLLLVWGGNRVQAWQSHYNVQMGGGTPPSMLESCGKSGSQTNNNRGDSRGQTPNSYAQLWGECPRNWNPQLGKGTPPRDDNVMLSIPLSLLPYIYLYIYIYIYIYVGICRHCLLIVCCQIRSFAAAFWDHGIGSQSFWLHISCKSNSRFKELI